MVKVLEYALASRSERDTDLDLAGEPPAAAVVGEDRRGYRQAHVAVEPPVADPQFRGRSAILAISASQTGSTATDGGPQQRGLRRHRPMRGETRLP